MLNQYSDYDCCMIVADDVRQEYEKKYDELYNHNGGIDLSTSSLRGIT